MLIRDPSYCESMFSFLFLFVWPNCVEERMSGILLEKLLFEPYMSTKDPIEPVLLGIRVAISYDFSRYFYPILIKSSTASFKRLVSLSLSLTLPVIFVINFYFDRTLFEVVFGLIVACDRKPLALITSCVYRVVITFSPSFLGVLSNRNYSEKVDYLFLRS